MLFNLVPLVFVVGFMAIGSKRGFVRELMGLGAITCAIVISTGKLDFIAAEVGSAVDASPLTVAIISFVLVLGLTFAVFKLAAKLLYKLIQIQNLGQRDQYGGALVGAVRGWLIVGALLFVTVLLPLPQSYYALMDRSILATSSLRSVQYVYDLTEPLHPAWPSFVAKVENTLTAPPVDPDTRKRRQRRSPEERIAEESAVQEALGKVRFYFSDS
jgi:uncharacterized membrane protein required for colicin V production